MRIEAGRGSSDLDEMLEDFAHFIGIRDNSQHPHFRPALATPQRVDVGYLREEPGAPSLAQAAWLSLADGPKSGGGVID